LFTVITQHLAEKTGGDIPTGGVILFPMIGYIGMIPGGEMIEMIIEGALAAMPSTLHQSDILCQRGRDYSYEGERVPKEDQRHTKHKGPDMGEHPQGQFSQGEKPQRDIPFSIDVKGGEIETLMRRDDHRGSMSISMSKCFHHLVSINDWC
jgi:hypothetical protein